MSASRERKKRMQQANEPAPAAPKKKKKKLSEGWIFAITIVLVVALVFSVLMIQLNQKRSKTVLTVGGHDVSVKEFNYFYNTTVNTLSSYASYVGIDTSVGLDKQYVTSDGAMYLGLFGIDSSYLEDKELTDGTYNVTWAQLIADAAKSSAVSTYVLYNAAMDAGFEVTEEIESEVEAGMDVMQGYADTNGESLNSLIRRVFGSGCNAKGYRQYLTVNYVAEHYGSELTYSAEEISARYNESPEDYDVATYYLYTISGSSMVEPAEDGSTDAGHGVVASVDPARWQPYADTSAELLDPGGRGGRVLLYLPVSDRPALVGASGTGAVFVSGDAPPAIRQLSRGIILRWALGQHEPRLSRTPARRLAGSTCRREEAGCAP